VSETNRAIEAVFRIESPRLIAGLARLVKDVGLAEEMAQDALVTALERWPSSGIPDNPGAWLMTTAKHRALDFLRHHKLADEKHGEIARTSEEAAHVSIEDALDDDVGDDLLRLIFIACHPVLTPEARVTLTLRLVGGLTTEEIARAFLVGEPTIQQRVVRAKKTLAEANVPFELPRGEDRAARLGAVLGVIYLVFNEGYAATAGDDWMRPALCEDALRIGRILAALTPDDAEVHGLVALMEIQQSRAAARVAPDGEPVLLADQDRRRWDQLLIHRGLDALARAEALGVQAAIAACHARAARFADTDWARIVSLYGELAAIAPSPVVELNRAVAVSMASGPAAGLAIVDTIASDPALAGYHLLPSVRGDLLFKLGRTREARAEFERAASMAKNARERALLLERANNC